MSKLRAALWGGFWGLIAWLPAVLLADGGVEFLAPIDLRQAALFASSAVLGVAGWIGAGLVFALTVELPLAADAWTLVSLLPLVGALGAALLPYLTSGFDRTLRRPWCLGVVVAAATVWSVGSAGLQSWLIFPGATSSAWTVWGVTLLCTQLVAVVPLILAAELLGESRRRAADDMRRMVARVLGWGIGGLAVGAIGAGLATQLPVTRTWIALVLLVPVVVAARFWATAGGVLVASLVGLGYLQCSSLAHGGLVSHLAVVEHAGLVLTLWSVGAVLGVGGWNQTVLIKRLQDQQELLERDLERVVRALSGAVEAKDQYTEGHLQRVTHYAVRAGRALGLERKELEMLRIASTLHDVGKIGIPESILRKPGPLTDEEYREMMRHPEIGARLLAQLEGFETAAPLVLHHQERFDGRLDGAFPGYPSGLAGERIPLGARIIAVVDAFDAMTSDRPYRRALPLTQAVEVLSRERGSQFDPMVVDVFLGLLEHDPWFGDSLPGAQRRSDESPQEQGQRLA